MKKILLCALLLCLLSVFSTNVLANAYLNFAGIHASQSMLLPFTLTTCASPIGCTPNPVLTPTTVTFTFVGGTGSCGSGGCTGTASSVFETFSTPVTAFALFSAPSNPTTTVTYLLRGHQVNSQSQQGGMYNLQQSAHTVFDTVEFSWSTPTPTFLFNQGAFDAVPEPSTLLLLGGGLIGMIGVVRRRLS
jgi:hypothetical protein